MLSPVASLVLFDTWFYWLHRLLHNRPLYRRVHRSHHLTVTPVAWSNNSDRLIDNLFLQSYWLVAHLLIPIAPAVLFAHRICDQITGVIRQSGFEPSGRWSWPPSPLEELVVLIVMRNADVMGTLHSDHDRELRANILRSRPAS